MSAAAIYLSWSIALGFVVLLLAVSGSLLQRGILWAVGARDTPGTALRGIAGRLERGWHNYLETFPLFAAAVLLVLVLDHASDWTGLGAALYFWARVVYVPLYAFGVPWLRSLAWGVAMAGIVMILAGLL